MLRRFIIIMEIPITFAPYRSNKKFNDTNQHRIQRIHISPALIIVRKGEQ